MKENKFDQCLMMDGVNLNNILSYKLNVVWDKELTSGHIIVLECTSISRVPKKKIHKLDWVLACSWCIVLTKVTKGVEHWLFSSKWNKYLKKEIDL